MKNIVCILVAFVLFSCAEQHKKGLELVPADTFEKHMASHEGQVIDVRTPKEYNSGHIKDAVNMHVYDADFLTRLDSLDKDETVYVYCQVGGRSNEAVEALQSKGFGHIVELDGGIDAWNEAGKPVQTKE